MASVTGQRLWHAGPCDPGSGDRFTGDVAELLFGGLRTLHTIVNTKACVVVAVAVGCADNCGSWLLVVGLVVSD